jgi:hypothetical protein
MDEGEANNLYNLFKGVDANARQKRVCSSTVFSVPSALNKHQKT